MRAALIALGLFAPLTLAPAAQAAPIFVEDFEDGEAGGWAPSGDEARLTQYADNTALRLSGRTAVVARADARGFTDVTISAALAAANLEGGAFCLVEVSADGGRVWTEVLRVRDGQDDSVTLHSGVVREARLDNAELLIGARAGGRGGDDQCWLDNVRVAGTPIIAQGPRTDLSRGFLSEQAPLAALAPMSAFAPRAGAHAPSRTFNGELSFEAEMTGFHVHRDTLGYASDPALRVRTLPRFAFSLVQSGNRLIPALRGPIPSGHPSWEFAVEPGLVWNEPADEGWTRAALPFALIEINANCTHNGVLTFVFADDGAASRVAWQIASETCAYFQFDAWGVSAANVRPGVEGAEAIAAADARELAARMPARPIAALAEDYPGIDLAAFGSPADIDPRALTTFGVVAGGVHYLGGCDTRAGPYPFCEALLTPSYSLAKSLVGGLGLMRLEMLHPGAMDSLISDHVPQCSAWRDVTFAHALDMATGRYRSSADQADENALFESRFFAATAHREKIDIACGLYPRREAPGRRWVYHTPDTYVLGAAMADFWRDAHGAEADVFDDVLASGVYAPLQLSQAIRATRRTGDDARQPFTGWGLTMTRDDLAKLGAYLVAPRHDAPLVDAAALDAAMQRNPDDRGLEAGGASLRYKNGFWAYNAQSALNCAEPLWIPFLSGFGGVQVALLPNGVVYYYVSDGGAYSWAGAARAAAAIAPLCTRTNP